ncbi:ankyrin repeat domain-containing protein [Streptomyces sp. NBC_01233]|uniref:ankyrin repeat domain-containing protein n=1 Tax=Streptomyces sp. NBC_01233 TaxID=2903787 RepID=UPI002E159C15|nr:ankyrin repeat domain-containing protein [Streptomyces sp. NBC_01233]
MTAARRESESSDWSGAGREDHYHPLVNGLGRAAENGDTALAERLLAEGADADDWVQGGRRALDLAVCAGHADIVRLLLAAGAEPRHVAGPYDESGLLSLAAMNGHTDVVRALLDAGVDPDGPEGKLNHVPLILAATSMEAGHPDTVDLLLERGADIEGRMKDSTALDLAAACGYPAMVDQLLARGAAVTRRTVLGAMAGRNRNADGGITYGWRDRDPEYAAVLSALRVAWDAR